MEPTEPKINPIILSALKKCPLFKGVSEKVLNKIVIISKLVDFQPDEFILREGEPSKSIYVILKGEVELLKQDASQKKTYKIATLGDGEFIAGLSILDNSPRENSIRVKKASTIITIPIDKLKNLTPPEYRFFNKVGMFSEEKKLFKKITSNLTREINKRIHHVSVGMVERELNLAKLRINLATLMLYMILLLSIYTITLDTIRYLVSNVNSTLIGIPILAIFSLAAFDYLKKTGYPLSFFGITVKNGMRSTIESLIFTLPILLVLFVFKYIVIHYHSSFKGVPLFDFMLFTGKPGETSLSSIVTTALIFLGYLTLIPLQELLYRGILQGSLQEFLVGRYKVILSIFGSSLVFSMTHSHISTTLMLLTLVLGMFWGWMYYRQKTLIGVSISHLMVGLWGTVLVGPEFALLKQLI